MITLSRSILVLPVTASLLLTPVLKADSSPEDSAGETTASLPATPGERFALSAGYLSTHVPVRIDSLTVDSTENVLVDDLDLSVGDETDITSNTLLVSASYFPIPVLELSVGAGVVSSRSSADLTISGQFVDPLPILGNDFSVVSNSERDSSGYTYNAGAAVLIPIVRNPAHPLALRVGTSFGFNELDNIDTTTVVSSLTLAHSRELFARNVMLALGASHIDIERVVTFSTSLGGGELNVRQEQSIDDPWSLNTTVVVPLDDGLSTSFSASSNFSGMYSLGLRLSYRF